MAENQDMGFGRCACRQWAIVKLNGRAVCFDCFEGSLRDARHLHESLAKVFVESADAIRRAGDPE